MSKEGNLTRIIHKDAMSSRYDVKDEYYPHADRGIADYQEHLPGLLPQIDELINHASAVHEGHVLISGLDITCGTSRAAADIMSRFSPHVDMRGNTLVYHPPIPDHSSLPRERIKIGRASRTGIQPGSMDFILDVCGLSHTSPFVEGGAALGLLAPGGFFMTTPHRVNDQIRSEYERLCEIASQRHLIAHTPRYNILDLPVYTFERPRE
jgi:hypothetical protein